MVARQACSGPDQGRRPALLVLARRPFPGRVKTRLIPLLGEKGACRLYEAFLHDTLQAAKQAALELGMTLAVAWAGSAGHGPSAPDGALVFDQQGRDLGARQVHAHGLLAAAGAGVVLFLGADSPTLPLSSIRAALDRLQRPAAPAEIVVVPALDGGYTLLGLRRPRPALFQDIPWGTSGVMAALAANAARLGLDLERCATWYDVDDGPALERLRRDLAQGRGAHAPRTAAVLRHLTALRRT